MEHSPTSTVLFCSFLVWILLQEATSRDGFNVLKKRLRFQKSVNYSHLAPSYPNLLLSAVVYFVSQVVISMGGVISLRNLWLLISGSGSSSRRLEARKKEFKVLLWPSPFLMSFMSMLQAQRGYWSGPYHFLPLCLYTLGWSRFLAAGRSWGLSIFPHFS